MPAKRDAVKETAELERVLEALGHPSRRQILLIIRLRGDEMTAGAVADRFRFAWPTITRHLAVLQKAGLLKLRKAGRERFYRVDAGPIESVQRWLDAFAGKKVSRKPGWAELGFGNMRNTVKP